MEADGDCFGEDIRLPKRYEEVKEEAGGCGEWKEKSVCERVYSDILDSSLWMQRMLGCVWDQGDVADNEFYACEGSVTLQLHVRGRGGCAN